MGPDASLVLLAFLKQQGGPNEEFTRELQSLELELTRHCDIISNGLVGTSEDGELQTDGYPPTSFLDLFDMQPEIQPLQPGNPQAEEALRNVAAELIMIADQLENHMVSQATRRLADRLAKSSKKDWVANLSLEVDEALKRGLGPGLEQLPKERVLLAFTMTLVKGVCERAPSLLRDLFGTALQYFNSALAR